MYEYSKQYFVIAGNYQEFKDYVRWKAPEVNQTTGQPVSEADFVFVRDKMSLLGHKNYHGVFVGTWAKRNDLRDLLPLIYSSTDHFSSDVYHKLWTSIFKDALDFSTN